MPYSVGRFASDRVIAEEDYLLAKPGRVTVRGSYQVYHRHGLGSAEIEESFATAAKSTTETSFSSGVGLHEIVD